MNKYLIEILKIQSSVILPGLGALMVPSQKAGNIVFNQHLKFNDGSFARYIAEKEGIDEQEAQNKVAKFVREIEAELGKGNSYDMFEFGKFFKTSDGQVDFKMAGDQTEYISVTSETSTKEESASITPDANLDEAVVEDNIIPAAEKTAQSAAEEKAKSKAAKKEKKEAEELKKKAEIENAALIVKQEAEAKAAALEAEKAKILSKQKEEAKKATRLLQEEADAIAADLKKVEAENAASLLKAEAALTPSGNTSVPDKIETPTQAESNKDAKIILDKQSKNSFIPAGETSSSSTPPPAEDGAAVSDTSSNAPAPFEEKKKSKKVLWLILLLLLIGLGVAGFFFKDQLLELFSDKAHETALDSTASISEDTHDEHALNEIDTANVVEEMPMDSALNETPEVIETPEPIIETPVINNGSNKGAFHLIGNSFSEEVNANRYLEKMKSKGYPAKIIGRYDGLYLVSLKSYDSHQAAEIGKSSVAADASSAWVFNKP